MVEQLHPSLDSGPSPGPSPSPGPVPSAGPSGTKRKNPEYGKYTSISIPCTNFKEGNTGNTVHSIV